MGYMIAMLKSGETHYSMTDVGWDFAGDLVRLGFKEFSERSSTLESDEAIEWTRSFLAFFRAFAELWRDGKLTIDTSYGSASELLDLANADDPRLPRMHSALQAAGVESEIGLADEIARFAWRATNMLRDLRDMRLGDSVTIEVS